MNGRRRTSRAALDVVRESLVAVNTELCAALGEIAVPVIGDEAGLFAVPFRRSAGSAIRFPVGRRRSSTHSPPGSCRWWRRSPSVR